MSVWALEELLSLDPCQTFFCFVDHLHEDSPVPRCLGKKRFMFGNYVHSLHTIPRVVASSMLSDFERVNRGASEACQSTCSLAAALLPA